MKKLKQYLVNNLTLILAIICVVIWTNRLTVINENHKSTTMYELHPIIQSDIDEWVKYLKLYGKWNDTIQARFNAINKIKLLPHHKMLKIGDDDFGHPLRAVGLTVFSEKRGIVLPNRIIFSEQILSNRYMRQLVVFHELGHALLMQDDISVDFDNQIMWYSVHESYCKFETTDFMIQKLVEQFDTPQSQEMIDGFKKHSKNSFTLCSMLNHNNK